MQPSNSSLRQVHYKKTPGCVSLNGPLYEVNYTALLFLKGVNDNQTSFQLASNMVSAGSFDDVIFTCDVRGQPITYFVQLKHKENRKYKIKPESLIQFSGDFSLLKYFKSFCEIKSNYKTNNDLKSCGNFNNFRFLICANFELKDENQYPCDNNNEVNFGGKCISFTPCPKTDDIYKMFEVWKHFQELLNDINDDNFQVKIEELMKTLKNVDILEELKKCESMGDIKKLKAKLGNFSVYKEFLNNVQLCTGQDDREKLEQSIKKEIEIALETRDVDTESIFRDFIKEITHWWDKENTFLNKTAPFWKKIVKDRISAVKRLSRFKIGELVDLQMTFNECNVETLRTKILSDKIVHVIPKGYETLLSTLKVHQALNGVHFETIITDLNNLVMHQVDILKSWDTKLCGCLVVEQNEEIIDGINNLSKDVTEILDKHDSKMFVLVGSKDSAFAASLRSKTVLKVFLDNYNLQDLEPHSKNLILGRVICFQGCDISLNSLLIGDSRLERLVSNDFLCQIAKRKRINLGKRLVEKIDYYVSRALTRQIHVKDTKHLLKDRSIGHLAISGMNRTELDRFVQSSDKVPTAEWPTYVLDPFNSCKLIEFRDSEREGSFQMLSDQFKCIHWFHCNKGKLIWKESKGDKTIVYQHLDSDNWRNYEPKKLTDINDKVVLIVAKAGMGKSTLLTHLAAETKDSDPNLWIGRVDLNDHTDFFNKVNKADLKLDTIIKFLVEDVLKLGNGVGSKLEKQLFEDALNKQGNIIIMFDGYDEISPSYADKVSVILKELQKKKVCKLLVTSRPVMRQKLERDLCTIAFSIKSFRESDQRGFLQQVWKSKIPDVDRDLLKDFVTQLLRLTLNSLSDKEKEFTGIPLQTMMLTEVFENDLKKSNEKGIICLPQSLNLLQLYKEFVEKKLLIYYREKKKSDMTNVGVLDDYEEFVETFMKNHMKCGLVSVFPKESLEKLNGYHYPRETFLKRVESGSEKSGIIDEIINNKPQFIHQTFAEYFAACWLAQNYSQNSTFLEENIFDPCYDIVKNIFDRILSEKNNLHMAVLNSDRIAVEDALYAGEDVNGLDKGGRTALHLAVGLGKGQKDTDYNELFYSAYIYTDTEGITVSDQLTQLLLKRNSNVNVRDSLLGWTPLQYADKLSNSFRTIGMLLEHGANPNDLSITKEKFKDKNYIVKNINVAIEEGYTKLISCMIKNGLEVDFKLPHDSCLYSREYTTILHKSVLCEGLEVSRVLFNSGANVDKRDSEGNTALHLAAKEGLLDAVKFLVSRKSNIEACNKKGDTPLHLAVGSSKLKVVKYLGENGADMKCFTKNGNAKSPLHVAACQDDLDIVKYLYENGGQDVCVRNKDVGDTPLHLAVIAGKAPIIRYLAERVVPIDICDSKGNTALHEAVFYGNIKAIKCLIEYGADMHKQNMHGETALYLIAGLCNLQLLSYLDEKGANFDTKNRDGSTALHFVAKEGKSKLVEYVAKRCSDINVVNGNGESPLMNAALLGNFNVVRDLIEIHDAKVDLYDNSRNTVLHYAVRSESLISVAYLFSKYKKELNVQNENGETPLIIAAIHKKWNTIKLLTKLKVNLHAKKLDNTTVLHIASEQDNVPIVKWLLGKHLSVNLRTTTGDYALHAACKSGALNVVKYLSEIGTNFDVLNLLWNSPLHYAVSENHHDIVKFLVEKNVNVNIKNKMGSTPLHEAVALQNVALVQLLVNGKADIHLRDRKMKTPLIVALEHKNAELTELFLEISTSKRVELNIIMELAVWGSMWDILPVLLRKGADINRRNRFGMTALHRVAFQGEFYVANYLLNRQAIVNVKDNFGITPLLYAVHNGMYDTIELLVQYGANLYDRDKFGNTVLHFAASHESVVIMKFLIENGVDSILYAKNKAKLAAIDVANKTKCSTSVVEYLRTETGTEQITKLLKLVPYKVTVEHDPAARDRGPFSASAII